MGDKVGGDPYQSPSFGKSLSLRVDGGVNALSINPSGRDVVLASRRGLHIIDLDDPFSPPRWLRHVTPWQVADVQWSPHPAKPYWVVSTSNQKAIIWNLAKPSSDAIEHVLHKHFRAITDINFSPQHPDILATCSIDTYVHAWDMRSPQRPFYTTSGWLSGASQVKWNFNDQNILASSHGNDVCIWDLRKGSTPLGKLVGHGSSVNSVDFNRFKVAELMTSSNDGTVRVWDYSRSCDEPIRTIRTDFPIWRGRYLPFGEGCCLMPSVGGFNSVYLASLAKKDGTEGVTNSKLQPVYAFKGHNDRVSDFVWRSRGRRNDGWCDCEFQLVTWSKDCDLKLWPVPEWVYEKVNFDKHYKVKNESIPTYEYEYGTYNREPEVSKPPPGFHSRKIGESFVSTSGLKSKKDINHISWLSGVRMNHSNSPESLFHQRSLQNLGEEVSSLGHKFPKVVFEKISVSTGELIITLDRLDTEDESDEYVFLRIYVKIPPEYPSKGHFPMFSIEDNGNLSSGKREHISRQLKGICNKCTESELYCLEPCLRLLLGEAVNLEELDQNNDEPLLYFDIADQLMLEELSTPPNVGHADYISDTSTSGSDEKEANDTTNLGASLDGEMDREMMFDTTPVPTECGAAWTPNGVLLCFFASERKQDKKQQAIFRFARKDFAGGQNDDHKMGSATKRLDAVSPDVGKNLRPKRYVETIPSATSFLGKHLSSERESDSDERSNSFDDDWSDILGEDIIVRTRFPTLRGTVSKTFESVNSESGKTTDSKGLRNLIITRDFGSLIPDRRDLALEFRFTEAHQEVLARHNALVAEKYGLEEKCHCWQILSDLLVTNEEIDPYNLTWDNHPMGIKWFIKEALRYFEKRQDIQMLAMLGAVISNTSMSVLSTLDTVDTGNLYASQETAKVETTINFNPARCTNFWRADMPSQLSFSNGGAPKSFDSHGHKHSPDKISIKSEDYFSSNHYDNNMSIITPNSPISNTAVNAMIGHNQQTVSKIPNVRIKLTDDDILSAIRHPVRSLLERKEAAKFKFYSYQYAKLLYVWGLPIQRAELLKISFQSACNNFNDPHISLDNQDLLNGINEITITWKQNKDGSPKSHNCNYCGLKVTRNIFVCENCEHVMHASCAREWWMESEQCATGCGCRCLDVFRMT